MNVRLPFESLIAATLLISALNLMAAQPAEFLLWPTGAPGSEGRMEKEVVETSANGERKVWSIHRPSITPYLPAKEKATGAAVIIAPGGAHRFLCVDHEGYFVAQWFSERGIAAFVLKNRLAKETNSTYKIEVEALADIQRAVRLVRSRASEWSLNPQSIGVMGFSAGGHLASTALVHFDAGDASAADPVDRGSSRPDFGILVYPVIALDQPHTHQGSKRNLLGERVGDAALVTSLSTAQQVRATVPPCFLVHTTDDTVVPPENSIDFYLALRRHKVPAELHIYEHGPHGFGLAPGDPVLGTWPEHLTAWLRGHGLLQAPAARDR